MTQKNVFSKQPTKAQQDIYFYAILLLLIELVVEVNLQRR